MRNLKFRVWNKKEKKWELGYDYELLGGFSMIGEVMLFGQYTALLNSVPLGGLDRFIITQSTGVLDSNGKEIYGKDIVKKSNTLFTVEWSDKLAYYYLQTLDGDGEMTIYGHHREIVGNVFENPEMLGRDIDE